MAPLAPSPPPRRTFTWKAALAAIVIAGLVWAAGAFIVRRLTERRWADMKARWQSLRDEARSRDRLRPPLRRDPLPGNAWDDYALVLREVRTLYDLESQAARLYLESGSGADRGLVEKVLERHPSLIDALRRGASRPDASLALEWKEGALILPSRYGTAVVARLAVCQARFLAERGRLRDAIELLVDACRFAGDLDHVEDMEPEFRELHAMIDSGRLSRADLEAIDRELEIVDGGFPRRGHRVTLELVALGSLLIYTGKTITPQAVGLGADPEASLWRFGFSSRLMKADAFEKIADAVGRMSEADDGPWPESRDLLARLNAELGGCPNPIARIAPDEILRSDVTHRGGRAQLRLIRTAARYRATGEILELEDPFGGKLRSRPDDDSIMLWSVGPQGRDHGGVGTFSVDAEGREEQDILLRLRR
jgi:hypothetical protein